LSGSIPLAEYKIVNVTVIVCTYNRSAALRTALESIAAGVLPGSTEWEVLVVDNNSRDQTRTVVEDLCQRYPDRFRYLFEPQPGKSYALNAGLREARGKILAFTDDDVIVEPTWLTNLTSALYCGEWAGAGGRILPEKHFSLPPWLPAEQPRLLRVLALFDLGAEEGPLSDPPLGANMAFRKESFERYGGFRTDLGPCPGTEIRGEDTEFGARMLAAGGRLRYEPSAVVYHAIPEERLRKDYFLAWWFDKGRSDFRQSGIPAEVSWIVGGIPLRTFRRLAVWTVRWMVALDPSRRFDCKLKVWWLAGQILESRRRRQSRVDGAVPTR